MPDFLAIAQDPRIIAAVHHHCDEWCDYCPVTTRCLAFRCMAEFRRQHGRSQADRPFTSIEAAVAFTRDLAAIDGTPTEELARFWPIHLANRASRPPTGFVGGVGVRGPPDPHHGGDGWRCRGRKAETLRPRARRRGDLLPREDLPKSGPRAHQPGEATLVGESAPVRAGCSSRLTQ
jgi:hypothetical protein